MCRGNVLIYSVCSVAEPNYYQDLNTSCVGLPSDGLRGRLTGQSPGPQPKGGPTANTTIFKPGIGNYMFELNASEWYL